LSNQILRYPIPISDRITFLFAEYGSLECDGHAVVLRQGDIKTHFPVGSTTVIAIEPGTVVTHAAVKACAESGCLLIWIGEGGVRCYAAGIANSSPEHLLKQAQLHLESTKRLNVARRIYRLMFDEDPPSGRSIEQLRGIEGAKVKILYRDIAEKKGIRWNGRDQKAIKFDPLNSAISSANAALYGLVEAAIVALGYSPSIGFIHSGDVRSFVYDISDTLKFTTVVPAAMEAFCQDNNVTESKMRKLCRDIFRQQNMVAHIIARIDYVLDERL